MNFSRQNSLSGFRDAKKSFFKKKELNIENEQEFPLLKREQLFKPEENMEHQMNYKEASLVKKQLIQEEDAEPGWTYLHADMLKTPKNIQKMQKTQKKSESDEELNEEEFKKKANRVFSIMINRWEKYKRRHKEFYGETHRNEVDYVCESQGEESSEDEENEDNDEYLSS
jgi:hypothetical protein